MVVEVAGGGSKVGSGLTVFIQPRAAETFVGMAIVFGEIEIVLDEQGTGKSVIANTVTTHPRVQKRKRTKEENEKPALRLAPAAPSGGSWPRC